MQNTPPAWHPGYESALDEVQGNLPRMSSNSRLRLRWRSKSPTDTCNPSISTTTSVCWPWWAKAWRNARSGGPRLHRHFTRRVNIIAIAQGSSERTIAIVVHREGIEKAVRAVHAECHL